MLLESILFNHGGHNRAPGQAGGRATEGWPRRGEPRPWEGRDRLPKAAPQEEQIGKSGNQTSGSERVKGHGAEEEVLHGVFRQDDKI